MSVVPFMQIEKNARKIATERLMTIQRVVQKQVSGPAFTPVTPQLHQTTTL
jgi:DNA-binding transcriptional regulator YdaS (Cro superfamily)